MAKQIADEKIKLSIIIDGNPAQKELFDLEKSTRNLNKETAALKKEKAALERAGKKETERYKEVTAAIKLNTATVNANKAKMQELQKQIGVTGLTMAQLQSRARDLTFKLRNLIPGSEDYKRYQAELKQVTTRMDELKGKGQAAKFSLGSLADGFNRYAALAAGLVAALTGVVLSIQKMIDFNGKLSDAQANVRKTTGMTKREVDELSKSFGLLRTRTGRIELLGIAEVGGRLGIAKEEIQDFVRVMDKSAVALGDSFEGGPDVVAEKLGRIKGLYEELRGAGIEEAFESVGSALNDLGADGTASEQNMAEFVQRVGSLPDVLKPSIAQALGLGAAFEESGLRAEVAGNNYGKVISIAARDIDAFAKVMRRPASELKNLINTDPTEFFFQFSSSLKGLDATQLAQVLDYLKLNDNEVKQVLGAASQNVDLFREKIALANSSMADATSLTAEYDIKNNTLGATLERLKKRVVGWFTSDSVVAFLESAVNGLAKLIGAVEDSEGTMTGLRNGLVFTAKVIAILTASLLSYTAGAKLAALWSNTLGKATAFSNIVFRVQYGLLVAQEVATKSLALAKALLSFNIGKVRAAYQALSIAMGMNPFGALLAVLGAVITAFIVFKDEANEANQVIKSQVEVLKQVNDETAKTKSRITDLIAVIKDENATYDQKKKALEDLRTIGKGYLEDLTMENVLTSEGTRLINRYIASIDQLAKAKAMVNVKSKLMEDQIKSDNKVLALSLEKKATDKEGSSFWGGADGKFFGLGGRNKMEIQLEIDAEKEKNALIDKQIEASGIQRQKEIDKLRTSISAANVKLKTTKKDSQQYKELMQDIQSDTNALNILIGLEEINPSTLTTPDPWVPDGDSDKKKQREAEKAAKAHEKRMDDLKKQQEELTELERKGIDDRLALIQDSFEKEYALEITAHRRKIEDLKKQMISDQDIDAAVQKMLDPKSTKEDVDYWTRQMNVWIDKNEHLHTLIELEEGRHEMKMAAIDEKAEEDRIKNLESTYELESVARETAHNNELAALGKNEVAKERLKKQFQKTELDRQEEHIKKMLQETEKIINGENGKIDFELLSQSEREQFIKDVEFLKLKLSEIARAKADLSGKGSADEFGTAAMDVFGDTDVLGFSVNQWDKAFKNIDTLAGRMQAASMVIQGMQNMWANFANYVAASENAQLAKFEKNADSKKRKLQWQLDNGYINQVQYNRSVERLDRELDVKRAELEYKQARRQKQMAIVDAIMNVAKGVTAALAVGPPMSFILSGLTAAMGALQIATIQKQPLPARGYEEGLYSDVVRQQDGKIFRSRYGGKTKSGLVNRPTHFLTGENGPEMIIDAKAYRAMSPETKDLLIRELRGIKGFEKGYYNNDTKNPSFQVPAGSAQDNAVTLDYALKVIERNSTILERAMDEGLTAYWNKDYRDLKKFQDELDRMNNSRTKAQR